MKDKVKYALPLTVALVLFCIMSLVITPLMIATPNKVPFAVVSLDEGAARDSDSANLGETLANALVDGESFSSGASDESGSAESTADAADKLSWTRLASEADAERAIAGNEYYGVVIIPKDFTSALVYDKAGDGSLAPSLVVPMLTIITTIMAFIGAVLISALQWPRRESAARSDRLATVGKQAAYAAVLSAVVAGFALAIQAGFAGLDIPAARLFSYLWLCLFCLMLAVAGISDLLLPLGVLVAAATFGFDMSTAVLAPEMLPAFWHDWAYPWAPQRFMAQGMRALIYGGTAPAFADVAPLLVVGGMGIVTLVLACALPTRKDGTARKAKEAEMTDPDAQSKTKAALAPAHEPAN